MLALEIAGGILLANGAVTLVQQAIVRHQHGRHLEDENRQLRKQVAYLTKAVDDIQQASGPQPQGRPEPPVDEKRPYL